MLSVTFVLVLAAAAPPDATAERLVREVLTEALPDTAVPTAGDRALFEAVLHSDLFEHAAVGPFDLYVMRADSLGKPAQVSKIVTRAAAGLEPLVPVMARHFGRQAGLVSGRRFPIVLVESDRKQREEAYEAMVALLDLCEADFSGWTKDNGTLWNPENRQGQVTRTWEVQIFNLAHEAIAGQREEFLDHGLGYNVVAHLVNRLVRRGTWGNAPAWFSQGLVDELDIEAYGVAWVGGDEWESQTPGWYREGWSGFLPEGAAPPPTPTGPPIGQETTVTRKGAAWTQRAESTQRHWDELRKDVRGDAPASFVEMTRSREPMTPRERAYARLAVHLVLDLAEPQGTGLLELMDQVTRTPEDGMPRAEPLPEIVSRALQGIAGVEALAAMPTGERLAAIDRQGVADRIVSLGAGEVLDVADHRDQSAWLYARATIPPQRRAELFNLFLEAEYWEQEAAWDAIGAALDTALAATLEASRGYPKRDKERAEVVDAFWGSLAEHDEAGGVRIAQAKTRR